MIINYSKKTQGNILIAKNFRVSEFACKDGSDLVVIDSKLVELLQQIRDHFGKPVIITSAYRSIAYNKKINGSSNSYHCKGMACDFNVTGVSTKAVAEYCESIGIKGIGLYNYVGGFVHIDTRDIRYYWKQDTNNTAYYQVKTF